MKSQLLASSGRAAQSSLEFTEYVVRRDNDAPLSFAGKILAATETSSLALVTIKATVYQTRGGKFITSLSKSDQPLGSLLAATDVDDYVNNKGHSSYDKAGVFDSLADAVAWFRPGRLTDQIKAQLGLNKPVRIE